MTPPATARSLPKRAVPDRSKIGQRRAAPRRPRRVSGPSATARSGSIATAAAIPAPGVALPRERPARPSSPSRKRSTPRTRRASAGATPGIALRGVHALDGISSSAFLDRLIRGRLWIGLLAFALIGIVAMQLLVLKLNTGIGRTLGHVATLQRENAQLNIEDSTYSSENRVAPLATAAGMTLAPAGTVHFVAASAADISRAAAALSTAAQTSASTAATASTTAGESATGSASTETVSQASSGTEASNSDEGSSSSTASSTGESAAGSSESQSTSLPSSASPSNTNSSAPGENAPSPAGAQAAEAPASSSSSTGAPASTSAGGIQAGTR
ncbi:MAG TPA: hypothetical protein VGP18_00560 [Solirubrobacteraceae bacterium]|nr:hypothetical protein [Solirubrobacteraceae bacterium]